MTLLELAGAALVVVLLFGGFAYAFDFGGIRTRGRK